MKTFRTHNIRKPCNTSSIPQRIATVRVTSLLPCWKHSPESHQTGLPFWRKQSYLLQSWSNTSRQTKHCWIKYTEADEIKSMYHSLTLTEMFVPTHLNVRCKHRKNILLGQKHPRDTSRLMFAPFFFFLLKFLDMCQQYWSYSSPVCDYFYIWSAQIFARICIFPKASPDNPKPVNHWENPHEQIRSAAHMSPVRVSPPWDLHSEGNTASSSFK